MGIKGLVIIYTGFKATLKSWSHNDMETLFALMAICEGNPHEGAITQKQCGMCWLYMKKLSVLLAICEGNPMDSPHKGPVVQVLSDIFIVSLYKLLNRVAGHLWCYRTHVMSL